MQLEHKYASDEERKGDDNADVVSAPLSTTAAPQPQKRPRTQLTRRPGPLRSAVTTVASSSSSSSSSTAAHPTAASWFALYSQLATQAHKLEREASIASRAASWLWESGAKLDADMADGNRQLLLWSRAEEGRHDGRNKEAAQLSKSIARISTALTPFLQHVTQQQRQAAKQQAGKGAAGEGKEAGQQERLVRELEEEMEAIEELLTRFKQEQKRLYLALDREEKEAEAECSIHMQRIQQWEAADADAASQAHKPVSRHPSKPRATLTAPLSATSAPPALQSLDADIAAAGGASGGWSAVDHDLFVSCWHASTSVVQCMQRLMVALPHKTERQCEEHVRWWHTYRRWMDERKFVIAHWKDSRQREKERQRQSEEDKHDEQHELEQQHRQQQAEQDREDKQQQAQSIAQWRQQRAQQRQQQQKQKDDQHRSAEQRRAQQRDAYHQQQKDALALAHATQQQAQLEVEARERVEREQRRQDDEKWRREEGKRRLLQHQAELARKAEERKEREAAREAADERRRRLLEESAAVVGVRAERDVGRLLARTEASEQHASKVKEELDNMQQRRRQGKVGQMSMQPTEVQQFIVPSWRQGV